MTIETLSAAFKVNDIRSMTKFLLVAIADQTNNDGVARTTIQLLAARTLQTPDSIERGLKELEAAQLVHLVASNGKGRRVLRVNL